MLKSRPPALKNGEYFQQAVDLVTKATEEDKAGNYEVGYLYYKCLYL